MRRAIHAAALVIGGMGHSVSAQPDCSGYPQNGTIESVVFMNNNARIGSGKPGYSPQPSCTGSGVSFQGEPSGVSRNGFNITGGWLVAGVNTAIQTVPTANQDWTADYQRVLTFSQTTEQQIRTSLESFVNGNADLMKSGGPGAVVVTTPGLTVSLDIEYPQSIWWVGQQLTTGSPANYGDTASVAFFNVKVNGGDVSTQTIVDLYFTGMKRRIDVARQVFPTADLALYPAAAPLANGNSNAGWLRRCAILRLAAAAGVFDSLDYLAYPAYVLSGATESGAADRAAEGLRGNAGVFVPGASEPLNVLPFLSYKYQGVDAIVPDSHTEAIICAIRDLRTFQHAEQVLSAYDGITARRLAIWNGISELLYDASNPPTGTAPDCVYAYSSRMFHQNDMNHDGVFDCWDGKWFYESHEYAGDYLPAGDIDDDGDLDWADEAAWHASYNTYSGGVAPQPCGP